MSVKFKPLRGPSMPTREDRRGCVGPTPETRAKLEPDVARQFFLSGKIRQHHWDAAVEIRAMSLAIGRGMFPAFRPREGGRVAGAGVHDFLDLMTTSELAVYTHHYVPWRNEMGREAEFAWALVINHERLAEDSLARAIAGLQRYAEIAGFCSRKAGVR